MDPQPGDPGELPYDPNEPDPDAPPGWQGPWTPEASDAYMEQQRALQVGGPGAVPPPLDENRGTLGQVPDQLTLPALIDRGFTPEAAQEMLDRTAYVWNSDAGTPAHEPLGWYNATPEGGVVNIGDRLVNSAQQTGGGFGFVAGHEGMHAEDQPSGRDPLNVPTEAEVRTDAGLPGAFGAANRAIVETPPGGYDPASPFQYDITDPAHYNTGLYERLGQDATQLPPDYAARYYPYLDPTRPSPAAVRTQAGQRGSPDPGEQAARERYWQQVPYYMGGEDDTDPRWLDAMNQGPPPIAGAYDTMPSDLGGYVDRQTGEYVPFPEGALMRLLYIPLSDDVRERLCALAAEQKRRPQDQAALIIEAALGLRPPLAEIPVRPREAGLGPAGPDLRLPSPKPG